MLPAPAPGMVGKPNLPSDCNQRGDIQGSSLDSFVLPLDQERAASMADEGGVAGAFTDAREQAMPQGMLRARGRLVVANDATGSRPSSLQLLAWAAVLAGAIAALGGMALLWLRGLPRKRA